MVDVRKEMSALPPLEGNTFWDTIRFQIRECAATRPPESFFGWSPIAHTINIGPRPDYLKQEEDFVLQTSPMVYYQIVHVKQMFEKDGDKNVADTIYANLMHQACHLLSRPFQVGPTDWVFEFGSGFGIMLLLVQMVYGLELHISTYDLPELQILQRFFLEWASQVLGIDYLENVYFEKEITGFPNKRAVNLFIAAFSLSEVPDTKLRSDVLSSHVAHQYLIVYQKQWQEGLNNEEWFNNNLVNANYSFIRERNWKEEVGFLHYNNSTVHLTGI